MMAFVRFCDTRRDLLLDLIEVEYGTGLDLFTAVEKL